MSRPQTVLVTTTIRVPTFLKLVCENAARHGRTDFACLVIGDTKTPADARSFCQTLAQQTGISIEYFDIADQERALADHPALSRLIPLNSGVRKQIGLFLAYLRGFQTVVMLDDDNFVTDTDFFGFHQAVGTQATVDLLANPSGWQNVYECLVEERGMPCYPRGYPWSQRTPTPPATIRTNTTARIVATNGFVLGDPDVDAITRLFWPIRITGMKPGYGPHIALAPGTWSPFNNQNTAITGELLPVYFTPPSTGRNADIWTAYVICRLTEHMGDVIAFGQPLVRQDRNPHNLWKDLDDEQVNNQATEPFVSTLREVRLTARTYVEALDELISGCLAVLPRVACPPESRAMIESFWTEYRQWAEICASAVVTK